MIKGINLLLLALLSTGAFADAKSDKKLANKIYALCKSSGGVEKKSEVELSDDKTQLCQKVKCYN